MWQQRTREAAEEQARYAAQPGDEYMKLLAEGIQYDSQQDSRRAARAYREAIALRPDDPVAYLNLGAVLGTSGHKVEATQRFLEAKKRSPVGSELWAVATAKVFEILKQEECSEVATPEWWNDEGLKALSARVVRAAPSAATAATMRAVVLSGAGAGTWEAGPRSAAEFKEAAACFDRAAALSSAPAVKAQKTRLAELCRGRAEDM